MGVALIFFAGVAASITLGVREHIRQRRGAPAQTGVKVAPDTASRKTGGATWGIVFTAIQLFCGIWAAAGLVDADLIAAAVTAIACTGCAYLSWARPRIAPHLKALFEPGGRFPHPQLACLVAILLAGIFATLALEVPSNTALTRMYPQYLLLEISLVCALVAGAFYLFGRRAFPAAIASGALFGVGIAEYFVVSFKSMPLQPGDLSALSTAAAVGSGYSYTLSASCLYGIVFLALSLLASEYASLSRTLRQTGLANDTAESIAHKHDHSSKDKAKNPIDSARISNSLPHSPGTARSRARIRHAANAIAGLLCFGFIAVNIFAVDYYDDLQIHVYAWRPLNSYYRMGFLPSFISSAQTIWPDRPTGYDKEEAEELLAGYAQEYDDTDGASVDRQQAVAQYEEQKPSVIVIMDESFSDLSIYENLHADYEGPAYFNRVSDALLRGTLYVSAYGGGTCNTEFEFLTGDSMAYLGQGVYPFTTYDLTQAENLAAQFSAEGYTTTALHPNHASNWNRENAFSDLGFDEFLDIEDFEGADKLRGLVTDTATFDKMLTILQSDDSPQFIFDITMQNHSGYSTGAMPESMRTDYRIDGTYSASVNEYLALIDETDRALRRFIGELRDLDRPVVVVFFGDHQPSFTANLNDMWFTGETQVEHSERQWQTSYMIWANYDVAGCAQESEVLDTSTNYLGALLMEAIGAPLSDYQKAQLVLRESMPAINTPGYQDSSGTWYLMDDTDVEETSEADTAEGSASAAGENTSAGDASVGRSQHQSADTSKQRAVDALNDFEKLQYLKLFDHGGSIFTKTPQDRPGNTNPNA